MSERLAQAWVECTSEWDYAELPYELRMKIAQAADAFEEFVNPTPVWPRREIQS